MEPDVDVVFRFKAIEEELDAGRTARHHREFNLRGQAGIVAQLRSIILIGGFHPVQQEAKANALVISHLVRNDNELRNHNITVCRPPGLPRP